MSEKTIEELKEELEQLKKQNLEKELAVEQAKLEKSVGEEKEKAEETLKEKIRGEVLEEMTGKSKLDEPKDGETLGASQGKWEHFSENYVKKHGLTGKSYEDQLEDMVGGGY